MRPPLEFPLGFVAIEVSLWRCTGLLPEVSLVFVYAEAIVGEVSPTYASRPEISLETLYPLDLSLGFVAIEVSGTVPNYYRRSLQYLFVQKLL